MGKQIYEIEVLVTARFELDDQVIDVVDDEWREQLYNLKNEIEIAEHIGWNLVQGLKLSQLDGWADQPDSNAKILPGYPDYEIDSIEKVFKNHS